MSRWLIATPRVLTRCKVNGGLADKSDAMETSVLLCIDFFLNRDPRKGCTLEQAFADALAQPEDWVFSGWDEGRSWEEAGCALPLPKGHRVCRTNWNQRGDYAPRSAVANKLMSKLYNCPLREAAQQLPNVREGGRVAQPANVVDDDDARRLVEQPCASIRRCAGRQGRRCVQRSSS